MSCIWTVHNAEKINQNRELFSVHKYKLIFAVLSGKLNTEYSI